LEIERARFGPRLRVDRQIATGILDVPVPSLILQPLVENAVRHGHGQDGQVSLAICVQPDGDHLIVEVADQGPGMPPNHAIGQGTGFGLSNVDQRLRKTYGEDYGLEIRDNVPNGALVTVRIPLRGNEHTGANPDR
ncbi:MAG: ATP-binding protein, partial [Anaerolineae bacterium]